MRAIHVVRLTQAWTHALARHLDDAEFTDLRHGRLGAILRQILAKTILDVATMLHHAHVDEVIHDHSAQIAQSDLARDFVDGLFVGLVRVGLAVTGAPRATAVDIDRHQRLGLIDHQCAAGRQRHFAGVDHVDLTLDIKGVEDRHAAIPEVDLGRSARRDHIEERLGAVERTFAVDDDAVDRSIDRVANGAKQNVAFGVQAAGRAHGVHALLHHLPQPSEVLRIAREFGARRVESGGAENEAETCGKLERVEDLAHLAATLFIVDLAADADIVHVGHHHQQSSGDR